MSAAEPDDIKGAIIVGMMGVKVVCVSAPLARLRREPPVSAEQVNDKIGVLFATRFGVRLQVLFQVAVVILTFCLALFWSKGIVSAAIRFPRLQVQFLAILRAIGTAVQAVSFRSLSRPHLRSNLWSLAVDASVGVLRCSPLRRLPQPCSPLFHSRLCHPLAKTLMLFLTDFWSLAVFRHATFAVASKPRWMGA